MLRTALFLSREMGRGAKVNHLLMKPLYVQNKRQRKLVTRAADVLTVVVASVAEQLRDLQGA